MDVENTFMMVEKNLEMVMEGNHSMPNTSLALLGWM
jgi:hypothetical protein